MHTALIRPVEGGALACHVMPHGMTVRIDRDTALAPDAPVYCGEELPGDAIEVAEPVIVVEILSPGTRPYDTGTKLAGHFKLPSDAHIVLVDADQRLVVHHRRGDDGAMATRIVASGALRLDPPDLDLRVESLFGGQGRAS